MPGIPSADQVDITFIGNATLLVRYGPLTLLTDPNFLHRGERAYLGNGLSSRRLHDPAMELSDLPSLDAVVLSHLHGDHWDRRARRGLRRDLPILTTPHASRRLQGLHGFSRAVGLRTWQSQTVVREGRRVRVTALPGRHGPKGAHRLLPPVMGSMWEFGAVESEPVQRLYVTGDTLMFPGIREIARRYPDVGLAVLHLGGTTLPGGLLVTMNGRQGAELVRTLQPRTVLPVHYEEYGVMRSPLSDFLAEAVREGFADRVVRCERGERFTWGDTG
ncbi:MBL fold metallo-hydrolase [Streptomyces sp. AM 2-1-1]|uniref:MBL fold metallo-hydrolase n=1 Tax=Streptomyces sp. AM 2-1-1 TaxID=3028709 RepID=UPI0023B9124D|nr:MBL fold metallo-hydrolase [Streptomyces sp. AM 2-1-1]WEH38287.1 MBL fold metallo-hydrolase [Streptomyces sp. AM 2-1-1]